jgi:L-lactate utilization protein LutC
MNIKFKQPKALDGKQLIDELAQAGITAADIPNIDSAGHMWIDIDAEDEAKASLIVAAHVGITKPLSVVEKLASAGLSIEELKAALA